MKSVVICGSNRFAAQAREFAKALEELGVTVHVPHFYRESGGDWKRIHPFDEPFVASGLTHDHFQKIRMADVAFVYNEDGYSGVSTSMEIAFATALGKPIYALSDKDPEICRKILFAGFTATPEDLFEKL